MTITLLDASLQMIASELQTLHIPIERDEFGAYSSDIDVTVGNFDIFADITIYSPLVVDYDTNAHTPMYIDAIVDNLKLFVNMGEVMEVTLSKQQEQILINTLENNLKS